MSAKLEKDEQIDIGAEEVDPSSEDFADIFFTNALYKFTWTDIINYSFVCKGWRTALTGSVVTDPVYAQKFRNKFGEQKMNNLFKYRRSREEKTVKQSLLLALEAQMLLRELAEYEKPSAPKIYADVRSQIGKFPIGDSEEQDLLARIAALRKELLKGFKRNANVEKRQKVLEHKIGLLIMHRTSIVELDRKRKKKKVEETDVEEKATFYRDQKKLAHYSNLFYLLRTEPKYFARLAYFIHPVKKEKQQFAETVILTMYANAFSPLEEFLLIELLQTAIDNEIKHANKIEEFTETDSVVPMMIMSYNKRKQGRQYINETFSKTIWEVIKCGEKFGADPKHPNPDRKLLEQWCDKFIKHIMDTVDSLPYGLRLVCKHIHDFSREKFKKAQERDFWKAVGYFVYYRFIGVAITTPDDFGICEKDDIADETVTLNLISIAKVLKAVFTDQITIQDGSPFMIMNDYIESKIPAVRDYFKHVIDVAQPEEALKVNKYRQLSKIEKDTLVILLKEIVQIHQLVSDNKEEIAPDEKDPLRLILKDLGDIPKCPSNDETEIQLELSNRFPPQLSKLERKKNLKTQTVDDAIRIMQKIPGFSGDTFLEIFVRMKLHCKKHGQEELATEVNNVIASLQNLAKYNIVKPDNGFNSFLKDIQAEVIARGKRKEENLKEIERLKTAIKDLDQQKDYMDKKCSDFEAYLESIRQRASAEFTQKTKKFKYKDLQKAKVIADSEIPSSQQGKVQFTITQTSMEQFDILGKIKGLPGFSREFQLELEKLLEAKEDGETIFDTEKGLELYVASTLVFLNKYFFSAKK